MKKLIYAFLPVALGSSLLFGDEPNNSQTQQQFQNSATSQFDKFHKPLITLWDKGMYHPGVKLAKLIDSYKKPSSFSNDTAKQTMLLSETTREIERAYIDYQLSFHGNGFDRDAQKLVTRLYAAALQKLNWIEPFIQSDDKNMRYFILSYNSIKRRHEETRTGTIVLAGADNIVKGPVPQAEFEPR